MPIFFFISEVMSNLRFQIGFSQRCRSGHESYSSSKLYHPEQVGRQPNAAKYLWISALHGERAGSPRSVCNRLYFNSRASPSARTGATADLNSNFHAGMQRVTRTGWVTSESLSSRATL